MPLTAQELHDKAKYYTERANYGFADPRAAANCVDHASSNVFNPNMPGDLSRIFKVDANGTVIRPFEGKQSLSEQEIVDVLGNESGQYYYCKAGSNEPISFSDGTIKDVEKPYPEKLNPITQRQVDPNEKKQSEIEFERASKARVESMFAGQYGSKVARGGNDGYRNFGDIIEDAIQAKGGPDYPDMGDAFGEADYEAFTFLTMTDPVHARGKYFPGADPKAEALGCMIMPNDMCQQRTGKDTFMSQWVADARKATKEALDEYKNGNPEKLAEHIARGIDALALGATAPAGLNINERTALFPAQKAYQMLQKHPDLYEAAKKYADAHGIGDEFERGYRNSRRVDKVVQAKENALDAEEKLIKNENGEKKLSSEEIDLANRSIAKADLIEANMIETPQMTYYVGGGMAVDNAYQEASRKHLNSIFKENNLFEPGSTKVKLDFIQYKEFDNPISLSQRYVTAQGKAAGMLALIDSEEGNKTIDEFLKTQKPGSKGQELYNNAKGKIIAESGFDEKDKQFYTKLEDFKTCLDDSNKRWAKDVFGTDMEGLEKIAKEQGQSLYQFIFDYRYEKTPPTKPKSLSDLGPEPKKPEEPTLRDEPTKPSLTFGERFVNFFKRTFTGKEIDKLENYKADMELFQKEKATYEEDHKKYEANLKTYERNIKQREATVKSTIELNEAYDKDIVKYQEFVKKKSELFEKYAKKDEPAKTKEEPTVDLKKTMEDALKRMQGPNAGDDIVKDAVGDLLACRAYIDMRDKMTVKDFNFEKSLVMDHPSFNKMFDDHYHQVHDEISQIKNPLKLADKMAVRYNDARQAIKQQEAPQRQRSISMEMNKSKGMQ